MEGSDYLTIIRAFRVLRPLRAINKVPSKYGLLRWDFSRKTVMAGSLCNVYIFMYTYTFKFVQQNVLKIKKIRVK